MISSGDLEIGQVLARIAEVVDSLEAEVVGLVRAKTIEVDLCTVVARHRPHFVVEAAMMGSWILR